MTDDARSGLDAVDEGPVSSDSVGPRDEGSSGDASDHPTVAALIETFASAVVRHRVSAGDQHVVWIDPSRSFEILTWLCNDPGHRYDMCSDVTAIDYGGGRPVEVVYQLYSTVHKRVLRLRCELPLDALSIASVVPLWKAADWLEREVYDMFGVTFEGHPDLRRILMPQDYAEGHPLRKDFPLRGRFSRAEQTRRALNQDVERFYTAADLAAGHDAQQVPSGADGTHGSQA